MTTGTFSALLLVVAGALIAFLSNFLIERHKERTAMTHRWDESLRVMCSDFAGTARELIFLSRQLSGRTDEDIHRQLNKVHLHLRALTHQIRLLGNREVQFTAQLVLHHAYAVRMVIGENKPDDRGGIYEEPPGERYNAALMSFYKSVRKQLKVEDPEDIPPFDIPLSERGLKLDEEGKMPSPDETSSL
ncbi:MAG: hypothetical protein JOY82_14155 [Streptosporangiaceae bacterium]|nr:hypothetical protein [Streptosporangiaceae bacterium]